jgi:uncharacterized membrane protein
MAGAAGAELPGQAGQVAPAGRPGSPRIGGRAADGGVAADAATAAPATWSGTKAAAAGRFGLYGLYAFTLFAVAGFAIFGVNPGRLVGMPTWAVSFYAHSFAFFALGHVWLAMGVLAVVLWLRVGARWLPAFAAIYAISLGSELAGTTWGIPFGEYSYSELLSPHWFDRVPVVIPLSWFFMALPSYALAALAVRSAAARVAIASLVLLAWDLALDPAMSYATRYWLWGEAGPWYGMPWLNLFGWYVTGLVLMAVLAAWRAEAWTARIPPRWWLAFYGANLLLPLGMCAAAGLWGAVAATVLVMAVMGTVLFLRAGDAAWRRA